MPVLHRKPEKVYLPSTKELPDEEQAWVKLKLDIPIGDLFGRNQAEIVALSILEWNFTDEEGRPLEPEEKNVCQLPVEDISHLYNILKIHQSELEKREEKDLIIYLRALAEKKKPTIAPPFSYQLYLYRKVFGLSWEEFSKTPTHIVLDDLKIMEHESNILGN